MRNQIQDYAKIGLVHSMAYPESARGNRALVETLKEVVEDDYFSAIELGPVADAQDREGARALLSKAGFAVAFGAQGILLSRGLDLAAEERMEREIAVAAVCEGVDEALALGASACGILAGKDVGRFQREFAIARLVESVGQVCRYAAEKGGMVIELEQFDRVPYGKNSLIGPTEEAIEFAQEIRRHHENFGLLADLSHLPLLEEKPRRAVNQMGDFLVHAHIGNCVKRDRTHPAYGDQHPVFGIPEGENDVPEIREFLAGLMDIAFLEEGGKKMLSFEVKPFGTQTTAEILGISKERLDRAWELL